MRIVNWILFKYVNWDRHLGHKFHERYHVGDRVTLNWKARVFFPIAFDMIPFKGIRFVESKITDEVIYLSDLETNPWSIYWLRKV
jgi:hypothetical protein